MPAWYDQAQAFANVAVEDVDKYNRLPFFLVKNETELFPIWNIWDQLFGDIPWSPNMGDTMKGVRTEQSPIGRALFYPNLLSTDPKVDVFETLESTETSQVRWHDYRSKPFSFLPSFQDFNQHISFNQRDIVRQVQNGNNLFIRTYVWDKSPNVFVAGAGNGQELKQAPTGVGNMEQDAGGSKEADWMVAQIIPNIKAGLTYKVVKLAATVLTEDINAPFFEGSKNMPKPNEGLKGKYILIGSNEAWLQFDDDSTIIAKKTDNLDLVYNDFQGSLANGRVTYKVDRFPLRFGDDGLFVVPQLVQAGTNKTRPNPVYVSALYEIAFLVGADGYRTIKVGPPPKDFTKITKDKFWAMRWNGEIQLTDQFIIETGTIAGGNFSVKLNNKGRLLRFEGTTTHGIIGGETYNVLPIIYKRQRIAGQ